MYSINSKINLKKENKYLDVDILHHLVYNCVNYISMLLLLGKMDSQYRINNSKQHVKDLDSIVLFLFYINVILIQRKDLDFKNHYL